MSGRLIPLSRDMPPGALPDDRSLIEACARGDGGSLDLLFDRHRTSVARYFGRVLGVRADLEDLVHATFIEVWKGARRYAGRASVRSWILGIASNIFRHHLRSESRKKNALRVLADLPSAPAPLPDEEASRRELVLRMQAALLELPGNLRETFVLCELEEVPREEAAEILGVRIGSIGRRIHEARKALRDALEGGRP